MLTDRQESGEMMPPVLPEELPTAFVCNCDLAARFLIEELKRRGLRVPEDISVTGFDDFTGGTEVNPPLSTFRVNTAGMVELTVKTVMERRAGVQRPFGRTVVGDSPCTGSRSGL